MSNSESAISSPATSSNAATDNPAISQPIALPKLECDIVMKGGITSGVVYPLAVVELAKSYRFRNVGGTSAGAIAAAATAAAELGRGKPGAGFGLFKKLPGWLQADAIDRPGSRLQALFQPQPRTRKLFTIMLAALEKEHKSRKLLRAFLRGFWPSVLIGAIPGVLVMRLMRPDNMLEVFLGLLLGLLVMLVGILLAVLADLFVQVTQTLPANNFGLCNGYRPRTKVKPRNLPLTEWLHEYLKQLAALTEDDSPLTFAHLQAQNINLLMMTTNLTHGLPHRLPFEDKLYFYNPKDFKRLFPPAVIEYLEQQNTKYETQGGSPVSLPNGDRLWRFPHGDDLPVVVAVRMSLSFPILLSAIPLYTFSKAKNDPRPVAKRCWFSDGGITSNFPVHFFDGPLPSRPTFAINLIPFGEGETKSEDETQNIYVPTTNKGGIKVVWSRFDQPSSNAQQLFGFLGAIFGAAQNWADNSQLPMPGYRDRIAHVKLDASEGGLNLNMPKTVIENLSERGRIAGARLASQFNSPEPDTKAAKTKGEPVMTLTWLNHRWVRYRTTMASLETYLFALHETYTQTPPDGGPSYENLVARGLQDPPASYRLGVDKSKGINQTLFALETTQELMAVVAAWKAKHHDKNAASFNSGSVPSPRAVLRAQSGGRAAGKPVDDALEDGADGEDT
jgi:predicted acylesterase/phospholipase RssA